LAAPFERLDDMVAEWCQLLPHEAPPAGYDLGLVAYAVELASRLAATQPQRVLLHGDFHPGNVLSASREEWLAIDCKPLVGDPAYDLAQWLGTRCDAVEQLTDPVSALREEIDLFSRVLDLDPARVAGWAFVKSLCWDFGPQAAHLLREVESR
jgi:streptomycin 6-kinase